MMRRRILLAALGWMLLGCTGVPEGLTPVSGFELERYLGQWYEIARLDHRFERGLTDVRAEYSLRDDGGVKVLNRGYDPEAGEWRTAEGKAYAAGEAGVGRLKVSFFGPFYAAYNILALDPDYQWALVSGPDRSYLWILSRSRELPPAVRQRLNRKAAAWGFAVQELIEVDHSRP